MKAAPSGMTHSPSGGGCSFTIDGPTEMNSTHLTFGEMAVFITSGSLLFAVLAGQVSFVAWLWQATAL